MKYLYASILLALLAACGSKDVEQTEAVLRPAKYMTIEKSGRQSAHTFSGVAQAKEEANLSFRVAGTVDRIFVKVGDRVKRGQVIASVDPADYAVQLEQAKAQVQSSRANEESSKTQIENAKSQIQSAKANYLSAKSGYDRIEKLYENNSVSLSQYEQAKANYEAAEATLNSAKAGLKTAQSQFDASRSQTTATQKSAQSARNQVAYTRITAPFNGVISNQQVEQNELVGSGTPIVTLSSEGKPEIQVGVPEILISKIEQGMETQIRFSILPDKSFKGKVVEVGYASLNGSTYPVTVDLIDDNEVIRPGMPAEVTFDIDVPVDLQNTITVPAGAVGEDNTGRYVLVLEKENESTALVKKQYITIGALHKEGFTVKEGLNDNMTIATAGLNTLQEGDKVRIN